MENMFASGKTWVQFRIFLFNEVKSDIPEKPCLLEHLFTKTNNGLAIISVGPGGFYFLLLRVSENHTRQQNDRILSMEQAEQYYCCLSQGCFLLN